MEALKQGEEKEFYDSFMVSPWAEESMNECISIGFITGKDNGRLEPDRTATRAEFATILMKLAKTVK